MKKDCFEKVLPIISMTKKGMFHLSCAFEPTLNPEFNEFLKMIPSSIQDRICFTSNLTTNIPDLTFELLSTMKFDHINVSIESFNKDIYEKCRKNAHYEKFISNLEKLTYYFKKAQNAPPLRYITIVTKLNADEVPGIIEKCHTMFNAFESEIRYPWITPGPWNTPGSIDWVNEHKLSEEEWQKVISKVKAGPYRVKCLPIQQENYRDPHVKVLWIRADGLLKIISGKKEESFNMESIPNAYSFLKRKLLFS